MSNKNPMATEQTTAILFFPEETHRVNKAVKTLSAQRPNLISMDAPMQYNLYKDFKVGAGDQDSDSEDDEVTEEERMEAYYGHYPNIYGYYQYFYGMKQEETPSTEGNGYTYTYNNGSGADKQSYGKYYKERYGNKQTMINIADVNSHIDSSLNQQYWQGQSGHQDTEIYRNTLEIAKEDKDKVKLVDDADEGGQQVIISNLISKVVKNKTQEEDNDAVEFVDPKTVQEDDVGRFNSTQVYNKLEDLSDLLAQSKKYVDAKNQTKGGKFTDPEFPPASESIMGFGERQDYTAEELQNYPWLRPEEFFKGNTVKVYEQINSTDILQGSLGDCYFLAAISSIAEYSPRLERLFLTNQSNAEGVYVLALCVNGVWQDVVLDDAFPCQKFSKTPIFNTSISGELWVMLLEKAWAKVHGGYLNVAAGLTREALRDLTGAPALTFFTNQKREELWAHLIEGEEKKYIMCAGSDDLSNGSDELVEKIGIAGSHAYSLLGVFEIENIGGKYRLLGPNDDRKGKSIERLVKLRNPWGRGEWNGDWGDKSPLWTLELQAALNFNNSDDGIFFISFNDFCQYYSDCQICYYHDDYKYSAMHLESDVNETIYLQFKLKLDGVYYLSVNQRSKRMFPKNNGYKYSEVMFLAGRLDGTDLTYVGGGMVADKENFIEVNLKAGEYVTMIKTCWSSFVRDFSFSIYGPSKTSINKINGETLPKDFIQQMMMDHAKMDTEQQFYDLKSQNHPLIKYKTFDNKGGFGYVYFENGTSNFNLEATVDFAGSVNIRMCYPYNGLKPSVSVPANGNNICVYEAIGLPYTTQLRVLSSVKNGAKTQTFRDKVRESKTVLVKSMNNQPVNVNVYMLYHADGLAMLYVNDSDNLTISEQIEFGMTGCHIEGVYGSYIEIVCGPKSEKMLKIVKDEGAADFSANITKMYYVVK